MGVHTADRGTSLYPGKARVLNLLPLPSRLCTDLPDLCVEQENTGHSMRLGSLGGPVIVSIVHNSLVNR